MGQAAARGLLPVPATTDPREPGAWMRLRAIAGGIRDEHNVEALRLQHARALSLFSPDLDQHQRQQLSEAVDKVEDAIDRIRRPWAGKATARADVKALELQWEQVWGARMDDPAMQARVKEACRQLAPRQKPPMPRRGL